MITADLGAGMYTFGGGQCHPGGDGARLQATSFGTPTTCKPPVNSRFIDFEPATGNNNLPSGQDLPTTFACMAGVSDIGCGFQQPLEAAYQALHDSIPENSGFLRGDALLVVLFLVDKDDCSLPPNTDLPDPNNPNYGPLSSFRCVQFGVACGNPPMPIQPVDSNGPLPNCQPLDSAQGGKLVDVQKYIDYFTQPSAGGGVKADPRDVILAAIAPPPVPFSISVASNMAFVNPSCVAPQNSSFFGSPAVRLRPVVESAATSQVTSTCDTSYQQAMQSLGQLIVNRLQ